MSNQCQATNVINVQYHTPTKCRSTFGSVLIEVSHAILLLTFFDNLYLPRMVETTKNTYNKHCVSKNDTDVAYSNFNAH